MTCILARVIYRPGFRYAKAGVILLELQADTTIQGELDLQPHGTVEDVNFNRSASQALMSTIDALNDRYGRGTVQLATRGKRRLTITKEHLLSVSTHVEDKIRWRRELCLALDEATRWNRKFMDGSQQKCSVDAQNARLIQKVAALEERVGKLTNQIERLTDLRDCFPMAILVTENKI